MWVACWLLRVCVCGRKTTKTTTVDQQHVLDQQHCCDSFLVSHHCLAEVTPCPSNASFGLDTGLGRQGGPSGVAQRHTSGAKVASAHVLGVRESSAWSTSHGQKSFAKHPTLLTSSPETSSLSSLSSCIFQRNFRVSHHCPPAVVNRLSLRCTSRAWRGLGRHGGP